MWMLLNARLEKEIIDNKITNEYYVEGVRNE
jgi:hypothetical protein